MSFNHLLVNKRDGGMIYDMCVMSFLFLCELVIDSVAQKKRNATAHEEGKALENLLLAID